MEALIEAVETARQAFIGSAASLRFDQYNFKPSPDQWAIVEIVEHLYWAEQIGVNGMWKALDGIKNRQPIWEGEPEHQGRTIEEVVALTWQTKEQVPDVARPRWGGALDYWIANLQSCQQVLATLTKALNGYDPTQIIYPHPISGPLNVTQRIEFLRFHLNRHQGQIERIKGHVDFPT